MSVPPPAWLMTRLAAQAAQLAPRTHRRRTSFYTAAIAMVVVSWRGVEATAPAVRAKRGQPPPPPRKILVEAAGYAASGTGEYYRIEPAPLTLLSSNR